MTMRPQASDPTDLAREYFRRADAVSPTLIELFTEDAEIYFPKFGRRTGKAALAEFGAGFASFVAEIRHPQESLVFHHSGAHVIVEGVTHGIDRAGRAWRGGESPGGRFCSVFQCRDGLIARMFIYLDPDYLGDDTNGFHWGTEIQSW